jgi:hypothetical protein
VSCFSRSSNKSIAGSAISITSPSRLAQNQRLHASDPALLHFVQEYNTNSAYPHFHPDTLYMQHLARVRNFRSAASSTAGSGLGPKRWQHCALLPHRNFAAMTRAHIPLQDGWLVAGGADRLRCLCHAPGDKHAHEAGSRQDGSGTSRLKRDPAAAVASERYGPSLDTVGAHSRLGAIALFMT